MSRSRHSIARREDTATTTSDATPGMGQDTDPGGIAVDAGLANETTDGVFEFPPSGMPTGVSASAGAGAVVHRSVAVGDMDVEPSVDALVPDEPDPELGVLSEQLYQRIERRLRTELLQGLERRGVVAGMGGLNR